MPDLDVDELVRLRRQSHYYAVFDPFLGDVVSFPVPLRDEGDTAPPEGPSEPTVAGEGEASDDDLHRYMALRETMRAIRQEVDSLEPKVMARAARTAGGILVKTASRELFARPRMFPKWTEPSSRDQVLREAGLWDDVCAYSWAKFASLYQKEVGLRDVLGPAVVNERRFTLTVRRTPESRQP